MYNEYMQKFFLTLILGVSLAGFTAKAQTGSAEKPASKDRMATPEESQIPPAKEKKIERPKSAKDLDAFFKQGEVEAKTGSHCQPEPKPIA